VKGRSAGWWWWLLTAVALGGGLAGWGAGLPAAMALTAARGLQLARAAVRLPALPVQVRATYLAILALGCWSPLAFLGGLQLVATSALLIFDYCVLARLLALLPWNRRGPLTRERLRATILQPPVRGSIVAALDGLAQKGAGPKT
jgi:hypothetical protein